MTNEEREKQSQIISKTMPVVLIPFPLRDSFAMAYTYNRRNLKRIHHILEMTAQYYSNPDTAHFILKLDSADCFRYFATYMKRSKFKQQYSYAVSFEYKAGEVGLHAHMMMVVDLVGAANVTHSRIRQVLADLKGVRSASLECRKVTGNKFIERKDANGQRVLSHKLKTELDDAKARFGYLAKIDQKNGVTGGKPAHYPKLRCLKVT